MDGPAGSTVEVQVLGRIDAVADGTPLDLGGPRQRALLARLAVDRGATVSTDALIDAVWDGAPPPAARRTFRTYVARLRRALDAASSQDGADLLRTESGGYRLDDRATSLDAENFAVQVQSAREQLARGDAAAAAVALAAALDGWEGAAYGNFADRPWAQPASLHLEELRTTAREAEVRALLDAGRVAEAAARAEGLAAEHPLRESIARLLVLVRYRSDRHAAALEEVRTFRERLAEETGLDPSPRLDELERMVLDRDPRLDRPVGGRRLRGYLLHDVVAETRLGPVHRGEQPSIGREVAITVLPPERADDPDLVRAFEARAQAIAAVEHPHVVPLYDYWREPGAAYLVSRFPTGGTLAQRLARGPLRRDELVALIVQVGGALATAHEHGVVHGGVGPDAVQLDARGDCFLWAFDPDLERDHARIDVVGFARLVREAAQDPQPAGGGVGTAVLTDAAVAVLDAARAGSDEIMTVAQLVRQLRAALGGSDRATTARLPRAGAPGRNPYRGLAAFRETDAGVFFGRTALARTVRGRLARRQVVAVVGPSGSGKSSLVRAGVLPALRTEGHYVTTMVPGTRPLAELGIALTRIAAMELPDVADGVAASADGLARLVRHMLPGPEGDLVLVVDQFEELFTLSAPAERDALLRALAHVVEDPNSRCRTVLTLRADFLGRVLEHPVAGQLVRDRSVMVSPMSSEELHEAVVAPAEVAGVAVEPAFATAVVADAIRSFGSLPLVQFALTEVYEAAEDGVMTLASYQRLGGIEGVLAQRAEEVVLGLADDDREAARRLFARLVIPNDDGPPTRRRAPLAELAAVPDHVIDAFGRKRLLQFDHDQSTREPTVEVTHEALFRSWPRLVAWIEAGEDDLRLLGHLTTSATDWDEGSRADADLYRGARLEAALAFDQDRHDELTPVEQDFLDAARRRRDTRLEEDRRRVRRLRTLTSGLAVGLVLALVAGGLAGVARGREAAIRTAAQADALAFAASAGVDDDKERAALLAAEAYALDNDLESRAALLDVLTTEPRLRRILDLPPGTPRCADQPPDSDVHVFTINTGEGAIADVRTFDMVQLAEFPIDPTAICATVDPSGSWVLTLNETGQAFLHDVASGDVLSQRSSVVGRGLFHPFLSFHPNEPKAIIETDAGIELVGLPELETLGTVEVPDGAVVASASLGEVGERVVVHMQDGRVGVGRVGESVEVVAARAHGAVLAERAGLVIRLTDTGLIAAPIEDPGSGSAVPVRGVWRLSSAAVSPDGTLLAVTTSRGGVEVFELPSMEPLGDTIELDTTFAKLSFSPDGALHMVSAGGVYSIAPSRVVGLGSVVADVESADVVWPASDGSSAIVIEDETTVLVDLATRTRTTIREGTERDPHGLLTAVVMLGDGHWARLDLDRRVFERWDGDVRVLSTDLPDDLPDHLARTWGLLRVDHGRAVATLEERDARGRDGTVVATWVMSFALDTGELLTSRRQAIEEGPMVQARALPDGRIVVGSRGGTLLVDANGEVMTTAELGAQPEFLAVSPAGDLIALPGFAEEVIITDGDLEVVRRLTGVSSGAILMQFVGDDRLVTQHADGSTNLWDLDEERLLGELLRLEDAFGFGAEPTTEGDALLVATPSGIIRMPLDDAVWLDQICALVDRQLARDELEAVAPGRELLDPCGRGTSAGAEA